MSKKTFERLRMVIAVALAGIVSISVVQQNFIIPIAAAVTAVVIMLGARKRVSEVIDDERDYKNAGDAARWTISIFAIGSAIMAMVFMALRASNSVFEILGQTLAYSACFVMLLQSALFSWFQKNGGKTDN